jgi:hypothetical protein
VRLYLLFLLAFLTMAAAVQTRSALYALAAAFFLAAAAAYIHASRR